MKISAMPLPDDSWVIILSEVPDEAVYGDPQWMGQATDEAGPPPPDLTTGIAQATGARGVLVFKQAVEWTA